MEGKLYSRKRFSVRKPKKVKIVKLVILFVLVLIIISVYSFIYYSYPIFKASCETAASSTGNKIIYEEVSKVMKNYNYNDLVKVEKDDTGKVNYIEAKIVPINEIMTEVVTNIQEKLDNSPRTKVFINLGSVSGFSFLQYFGPKFDIELETAGMIESNLKTQFSATGMNQTLHRIYLDISTKVGILTPFGSFGKPIKSEVLLTESIIVGEVPESYYQFKGDLTKNQH